MRCLVTGATGFIGLRLAETLLEAGHKVRCLVRAGPKTRYLSGLPVELFFGDIRNRSAVTEAVSGVEWVFHNAALIYHNSPSRVYRTNLGGTLNLLRACSQSPDLKRLVYSSSVTSMGPCREAPAAENQPMAPLSFDAYGRSKRASELACARFSRDFGVPYTAIRLAAVYGPRSPLFLNGIRFIRHGFFPLPGSGNRYCSFSHVDDVCSALILAATRPEACNQTYIIVDDRPVTIRQLVVRVAELLGIRVRLFSVPMWLVKAGVVGLEYASRMTSMNLPVNRAIVEYLTRDHTYAAARAKKELGWAPRYPDPLEGVESMVRWYENTLRT